MSTTSASPPPDTMAADRSLPWDWYPGRVPVNVRVSEGAFIETTFSFLLLRSERSDAVAIGRGASTYLGTMFDLGPSGSVTLGDFALVHGARIICDAEITIGDYALISWNVVLMDTYRVPFDPAERRRQVMQVPRLRPRRLEPLQAEKSTNPRPVRIGRGVWIGFDSCILPGVTIGDYAVVGARSVVFTDVEPRTVVAGNPARVVRRLSEEELPGEEEPGKEPVGKERESIGKESRRIEGEQARFSGGEPHGR